METEFEKLFNMSFDPLAIIDLNGQFLRINRAFSHALGWSLDELNRKSFWELNKKLDTGAIAQNLTKGHPMIFVDSNLGCRDGNQRQFYWTAYPDLETETIVLILRNIRSQESEQEIFRLAIEASPTAIFIVDNGEIRYANRLSELVFGYSQSEMIGKSIEMLVPHHLQSLHQTHREKYEGKPYLRLMGSSLDLAGQNKEGTVFPLDIGLNPVSTPEGNVVICSVIDLTKRKAAERIITGKIQQLENEISVLDKLVLTDELTSINNRRALFKQLELQFRIAQNQNYPISFILLDIDNFKQFNDSFGHPNGDKALKSIADILVNSIRKEEIVARYGGEEFGVILPETDAIEAKLLSERLRKMIDEVDWPIKKITVSVGAATLYPKATDNTDLQDINKLIIQADKALYFSKRSGKNRVTHFNNLEINPNENLMTWKIKHETPPDH